jgi:hypothetical protein
MDDITDTLAPDSTQLDAVDLLGGARTFTITRVDVVPGGEQPVSVHLAEFPRVWRPGKSMRRVLAACWSPRSSEWVGRRVTLYCDERVTFGKDVVGGTRISHLSDISGTKRIPLLVSRGKSATYVVEPLPEPSTEDRIAALTQEWHTADPERKEAIQAEVLELRGQSAEPTGADQ